jgi:MOSC domain-containing protein YiiM
MPRVLAVNVARARSFMVGERKFRSAILKSPIDGRVVLRRLGFDGDQQADRRFHGGPEKALYLYDAGAYDFWRKALRSAELPPGTFGENLTVEGFQHGLEQELHAGDVLAIGAAKVQLTSPRQPCWKLETRMGLPGFAKAFLESGRLGSYARVLEEGELGAGDEVRVEDRSASSATLQDLIRALYFEDRDAAARVLVDAKLDPAMRRRVEHRLR